MFESSNLPLVVGKQFFDLSHDLSVPSESSNSNVPLDFVLDLDSDFHVQKEIFDDLKSFQNQMTF